MLHTHLMVTDRLLVAQGRWLNSALARRALSVTDAGQRYASGGAPPRLCWARKGFRLNGHLK